MSPETEILISLQTLRTRLPPKSKMAPVDIRALLSSGYIVYVLATFTGFLGMYTRKSLLSAISHSLPV